jgi:LmbE family N-acetylglucosaminyl deacetylase
MTASFDPGDFAPLLVLAPHPDDDVLGCAGLMMRVAQRGGALIVVWLTDGGGSHGPLPPDQRASLVAQRRREALAGVAALLIVPTETCFLGLPDGALDAHREAAQHTLRAIVAKYAVRTVVVTDCADDHPDHRAAFAIARDLPVPQVFGYPVSNRYDGHDFRAPDSAIVIPPDQTARKRAALLCHRSQIEGGARYPLSQPTIERFCREPEVFIPYPGRAA